MSRRHRLKYRLLKRGRCLITGLFRWFAMREDGKKVGISQLQLRQLKAEGRIIENGP